LRYFIVDFFANFKLYEAVLRLNITYNSSNVTFGKTV